MTATCFFSSVGIPRIYAEKARRDRHVDSPIFIRVRLREGKLVWIVDDSVRRHNHHPDAPHRVERVGLAEEMMLPDLFGIMDRGGHLVPRVGGELCKIEGTRAQPLKAIGPASPFLDATAQHRQNRRVHQLRKQMLGNARQANKREWVWV